VTSLRRSEGTVYGESDGPVCGMSRLEFPVGVSNWHLLMAQEIADENPHCSYTKHPIKMASITGNLVVLNRFPKTL